MNISVINATWLMLLPSEALSTLILSTLYFLFTNPSAHTKILKEIHATHKNDNPITPTSAQNLTYLKACLDKTMRLFPFVVGCVTRIVPEEGAMVCGQYVPGGTTTGVHHWSAYHCERNFERPERWVMVEGVESGEDRLKAFQMSLNPRASEVLDTLLRHCRQPTYHQPFDLGPRTCIAKRFVSSFSHDT
jgi:cytochrome P450